MDHIIADLDLSFDQVPSVPDLADRSTEFPDNWEKFQSYPRENGWWLDEETFSLKLSPGADRKTVDHLTFLQSWLFFGLLMTIVQRKGKPILEYDDLVDVKSNGRYVTTKQLPKALERWRSWEQESCDLGNIAQVRLRMVRADAVLNAARRTIRATYGHGSGAVTQTNTTDDDESSVRDKVALSLMILGETLSSFKAQIIKITHSGLKGWHSEDDSGWGPPAYILNRMEKEKWCPRTAHLWRSQYRANATLMFASYLAYNPLDRFKGPHHNACTEQTCKATSQDDNGNYGSAHTHLCSSPCPMLGPDMTMVRSCLDKEQIPLLQFQYPPGFKGTEGQLDLTVITAPDDESERMKYATISHVWSDGFGNEHGNELHLCQLQYIRLILDELETENGWNTPFWMDTLIIPVGQVLEDKTLRKRAIKQIFRVFKESAYTVVLDAGLSQMYSGDKPASAAIRILGSSWMRRLWTLQEAFLSRNIYFAFEGHPERSHLKDISALSHNPESGSVTEGTTALLNMVNEHLKNLTLSHERGTVNRYLSKRAGSPHSKMPQQRTASLVANYWKAARWRTTSNASHETLALAALLDLDYENTSSVGPGAQQDGNMQQGSQIAENDRLVQEFWTHFNKKWPRSIPPGMLFLPGERVSRVGFGWALRTWMSDLPVDYPDPLTFLTSTAELDIGAGTGLDGLKVRYPGFLLHPQDRRHILATDKQTKRRFWFPTSPSFLDWYMVEPTDDDTPQNFIHGISESTNRLGIIVSHAKPGDALADIGLLVQIREDKTEEMRNSRLTYATINSQEPSTGSNSPTDGHQAEVDAEAEHLYCEIVRRVKISRETRSEFRTRNRARFLVTEDYDMIWSHQRSPSQEISTRRHMIPEVLTDSADVNGIICLAEELGPEQVWYVDGFFPDRHESLVQDRAPSDFVPQKHLRNRLLKMFGGFR